MSLEHAHKQLGWPAPQAIFTPPGAGPAIYADLARAKIQPLLQRLLGGQQVRVGVLARDPTADVTEEPLAVVCEFSAGVSAHVLEETHRLVWNFCRSKILIIVEPLLLRVWTCCEPPPQTPSLGAHPAEVVEPLNLTPTETPSAATQVAQSLHWLRMVSGAFVQSHPERFRDEGRADRQLLENLKAVRAALMNPPGVSQGVSPEEKLAPDVAHDLLARIIFIQFLFDRKDGSGRPALGVQELRGLYEKGTLSAEYTTFGQILRSYPDAYRFFRWLNSKFNGDLFPGKGATKSQCEVEWRSEMKQVRPAHLNLLALFIEGKLKLKGSQQLYLWPLYAFDAIPLEFISSIYEEFVGAKSGVHYTPGYYVDFVLDSVLPWESDEWDLRILDPACGSGIFLVKAFQRLVHRWRRAHPGEVPRAALLKQLLTRNLFGIDIDAHAVRVASFSLYLAMCDEIDPRHYWRRMRFPPLRGRNLIAADFFDERDGFHTERDAGRYDIVIGNAPWGQDSVTDLACRWAEKNEWPVVNKGIGALFLVKAAALTTPEGQVAIVTSASALLFNREITAAAFRRKLFDTYRFDEVINLSAVRFGVFSNAKSAACVVVFRPVAPSDEPFSYICPKPIATPGEFIVVEPGDVRAVYPGEAAGDPWVWTALLWGGRRDLDLVHRLARRPRLDTLSREVLQKRKGIVRGNRLKPETSIVGRHILEAPPDDEETPEEDRVHSGWAAGFPAGTFLHLRAADLPLNEDPGTEKASSTTMEPFDLPQLIIKKSWTADAGRFRAVLVDSNMAAGGVVCTQSYVSVHVPESHRPILEAACLSLNSKIAVYYLFLTSGRGASFIPEALVEELMSVPMPPKTAGLLRGINTFEELDERARVAFGLKDAEWVLIEDFMNHTIRRIQDAGSSGWRTSGERVLESGKSDLLAYCECFVRVLRDGLGAKASATVFQPQGLSVLPVHLVAVYLDEPTTQPVRLEQIDDEEFWSSLIDLDRLYLKGRPEGSGGVFFQRTARIYDSATRGDVRVPAVYIVKPRPLRYWTRSAALQDADAVVADAVVLNWPLNRPDVDRG